MASLGEDVMDVGLQMIFATYGWSDVSDEQAKEKYPDGWETVKPYLRVVAQPTD